MLAKGDDNAIVYLVLLYCLLGAVQMGQSALKYVETSCKMCLTTDEDTGTSCAVKISLGNRSYTDNCISTSDYRFCYVVKPKDRNQTNYGCTWPEADTRKYRDMNSCNKTTFMSGFGIAGEDDTNKTCACTRNCSAAGMYSFKLEGYQVYNDTSPSLGKGDPDPNSTREKGDNKSSCNQECIAAIAVSGVFVGLALVGAILYLYRRHIAKRKPHQPH